ALIILPLLHSWPRASKRESHKLQTQSLTSLSDILVFLSPTPVPEEPCATSPAVLEGPRATLPAALEGPCAASPSEQVDATTVSERVKAVSLPAEERPHATSLPAEERPHATSLPAEERPCAASLPVEQRPCAASLPAVERPRAASISPVPSRGFEPANDSVIVHSYTKMKILDLHSRSLSKAVVKIQPEACEQKPKEPNLSKNGQCRFPTNSFCSSVDLVHGQL
uniref:Uncharacterized protein n=1 Tax=Acanthochromis polyacanthus TaxID=80966 RepID=A0A3Q1FFY4_9TELE